MKHYPKAIQPGQLWTVLADDGISKNFVVTLIDGSDIYGIRTPYCENTTDRYKLPVGLRYEKIDRSHLVRLEAYFSEEELLIIQQSIDSLLELLNYDIM